MKRYEKYKDSGVDWIGEIPDSWQILKGKWLLKEQRRSIKFDDEIVTCFRDGQVTLRRLRKTEGFTNSLKEIGYQGIKKGDLVVHNMDAFAGAIGVAEQNGKSTPVYSVCTERVSGTLNLTFYSYYLRNLALRGLILSLAKGIRERSTDFRFSDLGALLLPFPSLSEQNSIVKFLDDKTVKIDQTISLKQKEINLLNERRQILIQKAVTKGLNDQVKMKNSGVDWIGEIPEHWEVRKLKYIGKMFSGLTNKKGDDFSKEPKEGFSPFIPFTNIFRNNKISENEFQFVKSNSYDVQNIVEFNDILFLMSSETFDDIGKNSIYLGKSRVFLNSFCKGFKIFDNNVNPLFINFLLLSKNYREYFASVGRGFTRINIKQEYVLDMPILYVPINEQTQIVVHLEEIEQKISKAISIKQQEIEKLKEYKTVLIDNVVTGKVKVIA